MREVSKLLDENETGALTQRKRVHPAHAGRRCLQAVREKKAQRQGEGQQQEQQPRPQARGTAAGAQKPEEQKPQEQQPSDDPLGIEAEIRLMIELQKHLKWETESSDR